MRGEQGFERPVEVLERSAEHDEVAPAVAVGKLERDPLRPGRRSGGLRDLDSVLLPRRVREEVEQLAESAAHVQDVAGLETGVRANPLQLRRPHRGSSVFFCAAGGEVGGVVAHRWSTDGMRMRRYPTHRRSDLVHDPNAREAREMTSTPARTHLAPETS